VVGHHGGGEGVAGWRDKNPSEQWVEEVGVAGYGVVEAGLTEGKQG